MAYDYSSWSPADQQHIKLLKRGMDRAQQGSPKWHRLKKEWDRIHKEHGVGQRPRTKEQVLGEAYRTHFDQGTTTARRFGRRVKTSPNRSMEFLSTESRADMMDARGFREYAKHSSRRGAVRVRRTDKGAALDIAGRVKDINPEMAKHAPPNQHMMLRSEHQMKFGGHKGWGKVHTEGRPSGSVTLPGGGSVVRGHSLTTHTVGNKSMMVGGAALLTVGAASAWYLSSAKRRQKLKDRAKNQFATKRGLAGLGTQAAVTTAGVYTATKLKSRPALATSTFTGSFSAGNAARKYVQSKERTNWRFRDTKQGRKDARRFSKSAVGIATMPAYVLGVSGGVKAAGPPGGLMARGVVQATGMVGNAGISHLMVDKSGRIKRPKGEKLAAMSDDELRPYARQQAKLIKEVQPLAYEKGVEHKIVRKLKKKRAKAIKKTKNNDLYYYRTVKGKRQRVRKGKR